MIMELSDLKGIGSSRLKAFHAAGIDSLRDLLYALPHDYRDASTPTTVAKCEVGEKALLSLHRDGPPVLFRKGKLVRISCRFRDDSGSISCLWFNQIWMKKQLENSGHLQLYGTVSSYGGCKQLVNPSIITEQRIIPLYRPIEGVPQKVHEKLVEEALPFAEELFAENLPESLCRRYQLIPLPQAIQTLHRPPSLEALRPAQRRFSFGQMLLYQTAVQAMRMNRREGWKFSYCSQDLEAFWAALPFAATKAQKHTLQEIAQDCASGKAMARMVQGDVGSGKTAVAMGAMLLAVQNGYQAALMAPTEILARQHYTSLKEFFSQRNIRCGLLLGGMPAKERKEALRAIESGEWQLVIGTHALIGKGVCYQNLGLCISDEQHRFGVAQRTALVNKGGQTDCQPHLLVMSATPIPRSLALILFGDLDISVINELPPGRKPVSTRLVPESKRKDLYGFVDREIEKGHQVYFVCSLVEKTEDSEENEGPKTAKEYAAELQNRIFPNRRIGLTWGSQPSEEKAAVLAGFADGRLDILVATTVIEVGVNVPNATLMIIEDASRYGLAQLHQLRGRVGRGSEQSWCFLLSEPNERLRTLISTNDGFEIANADLQQRGPGELLGTRQHGDLILPGGSAAYGNMELLYEAANCAKELYEKPELQNEKTIVEALAADLIHQLSEKISLN